MRTATLHLSLKVPDDMNEAQAKDMLLEWVDDNFKRRDWLEIITIEEEE